MAGSVIRVYARRPLWRRLVWPLYRRWLEWQVDRGWLGTRDAYEQGYRFLAAGLRVRIEQGRWQPVTVDDGR